MEKYASLIIDIENSRKYHDNDRNDIQMKLMKCVEMLNEMFYESLEFSVTFSAGDEIQGLFVDAASALMYFRLLEIIMQPVRFRAGIGIGEWTIKIENGISTQQDGPAYHNARRAIEEIYKSQINNVKIYSGGEDFIANHLINASGQLKRQQMPMQNYLQVLNELIYPFVVNNILDDDFANLAAEIITIKSEMTRNRQRLSVTGIRGNMRKFEIGVIGLDLKKIISPIYVDRCEEVETLIFRNMSALVLAQILQSSRQNASIVMKRGNVLKIRELDYVALEYVRERYM